MTVSVLSNVTSFALLLFGILYENQRTNDILNKLLLELLQIISVTIYITVIQSILSLYNHN